MEATLSTKSSKAKKRFKLSFVCQLCRKSKTKCDLEKPSCGRCLRLDKVCVYDLEHQTLPRKPSKDATIVRLQKELEYWKYFANAKMSERKETYRLKPGIKSDKTSVPFSKCHINLSFFKPQLVYQEFRFSELKPFTNMAQIKLDRFLSTFLGSFFASASKEELLHNVLPYLSYHANNDDPKYIDRVLHLRQNLLMRFSTEAQSNRIQDFTDRLLTGKEVLINYRTSFFVTMFGNVFFQTRIEDFKMPEDPYPAVLEKLLLDANNLLPSKTAILLYKSYFYKRLYHIYPYFDIEMFEKTLDEILVDDPMRTDRMTFDMGVSNFRYKLTNIALLMLVLKVSYGALISVVDTDYNADICDSDFLKQNPIIDQCILFAETCIAKMCIVNGTNEFQISCMLFVWNFFCVGNGDDDSMFGRSTDVVTEMVFTLAMNSGLGRDATQYKQYQLHPSAYLGLQNLRRKLSLNVISTSIFSGMLTGNFPNNIWSNAKNFLNLNGGRDDYIGLVKRSMKEANPLELKMHDVLFKTYKMLVLLMDLEKLVKKGSPGMSITDIHFVSNSITEALSLNFSMDFDFIGGPKTYEIKLANGSTVECDVVDSYHHVKMQLFVRNLLIHLNKTLFLYFEDLCVKGEMDNLFYYKAFLMKTVQQGFELAKLSILILEGGFDKVLVDGFNMEKCKNGTEFVFPTVLYSLLGFGVRLAHAELGLIKNIKSFESTIVDMSALNARLELLTRLRKNTFFAIGRLADAMSASFQYKNFCTFRSLLFIDAVIKLDMSRGLMDMMFYALNPENEVFDKLNSDMKDLLTHTLGINFEKPQEEKDSLERAQFLSVLDERLLLDIKVIVQSLGFSYVDNSNGDDFDTLL
ncbi:unnamed protein product [Kluyveromyces dobzhanskii CBS 2104]|uniref:WGS project CCBQ000000000 data, contig 00106 n=1 Tax=Kluyveromyces dobzhanskii CBS 2104 TaxID=1427455 RepID=A0A0A8L5U9_9SACH|nr:unnamed protein product [Kluyveromyces dobzhanskii CBS 2104]